MTQTIDLTSDLDVLFATLAGEAEAEPLTAKQAVAGTILQRVKLAKVHPHFGDGTVRGACRAPFQYSCWLPGPDRDRILAIDLDNLSPAQQECMAVAQAALDGTLASLAGEATHYYAPAACDGPAWLVGAKWRGQFGTQLFWANVK